jgi:hypothetical protein
LFASTFSIERESQIPAAIVFQNRGNMADETIRDVGNGVDLEKISLAGSRARRPVNIALDAMTRIKFPENVRSQVKL